MFYPQTPYETLTGGASTPLSRQYDWRKYYNQAVKSLSGWGQSQITEATRRSGQAEGQALQPLYGQGMVGYTGTMLPSLKMGFQRVLESTINQISQGILGAKSGLQMGAAGMALREQLLREGREKRESLSDYFAKKYSDYARIKYGSRGIGPII